MICKIQLHYEFAKKYASANSNNHQTPQPHSPGKIFWIRATGGNKRKVEEYSC